MRKVRVHFRHELVEILAASATDSRRLLHTLALTTMVMLSGAALERVRQNTE